MCALSMALGMLAANLVNWLIGGLPLKPNDGDDPGGFAAVKLGMSLFAGVWACGFLSASVLVWFSAWAAIASIGVAAAMSALLVVIIKGRPAAAVKPDGAGYESGVAGSRGRMVSLMVFVKQLQSDPRYVKAIGGLSRYLRASAAHSPAGRASALFVLWIVACVCVSQLFK